MKDTAIKKVGFTAGLPVVFFMFCFLLQATEEHDENAPLLVGAPNHRPHFLRGHWQEKLKRCLAQENHVKVLYFPKDGQYYSGTYDVSASTTGIRLFRGWTSKKLICPTLYALQQEFLKGYVLKKGVSPPAITEATFCAREARLDLCSRKSFFSNILDAFVQISCRSLAAQDQKILDYDGEELTADILKTVRPKHKHFRWKVAQEEDVLQIMQESPKQQAEVLLIIGGEGFLWGRLTSSVFRSYSADERSLLSHKIDRVFAVMCAKYPFSEESYKFCANNEENLFDADVI